MPTSLTVVELEPLTLAELARAVGVEESWIVALVEVEILPPAPTGPPPGLRRFRSEDLRRALEARRLERDFGANLDTAALVLDLQDEIRRLRALLGRPGPD